MQHYPNANANLVACGMRKGRRTTDVGGHTALVTVTSVKMIVDSRVRICGLILAYFVTCRHSCSEKESESLPEKPGVTG